MEPIEPHRQVGILSFPPDMFQTRTQLFHGTEPVALVNVFWRVFE